SSAPAADAKTLVTGLKNPRAVAVGPDRRVYVTVCEDPEKASTGAVIGIENAKARPFASGLDVPLYMTSWQNWLFVTDKECVWRIDRKGKADQFVRRADFPNQTGRFGGICVDERGMLYVAAPNEKDQTAVFRITPGAKIEIVPVPESVPFAQAGIAMDGMSHLLLFDRSGSLHRINLDNGSLEIIVRGDDQVRRTSSNFGVRAGSVHGGVAWDHQGRLYLTGQLTNVEVIPRPGKLPLVFYGHRSDSAGGPALSADGKSILVPDVKAGTITAVPTGDPTDPIDESPLPLATEVAFPDLQWSGWAGETPAGKPNPLRPLVLTHANDQSGRNFVATQHGVIHVFPNDQAAKATKVFLDISDKVRYDDKSNEEGFLGLAFHPDYKRTGEFFVFYTERTPGHNNVLCRYRVSKDDPDRADPASEEVLLRVQHKYWNHDGGTVIFGPDGYLYLALGDGGAANDPDRNGPNLNTLLGKIIRIDVNRRDGDRPYGIPKDNPFVGRAGARPEIYAYGLRNVWRMAFDRPTGRLWAADVGQNIYEEI
ncbi:MAG TPA: PQQ-dependent sugar dehydrogenase, partial [Gemmataceae bacterium]|nr:PQQ-dependent sugar dehydrogenase [Gemmataceae bacterium]